MQIFLVHQFVALVGRGLRIQHHDLAAERPKGLPIGQAHPRWALLVMNVVVSDGNKRHMSVSDIAHRARICFHRSIRPSGTSFKGSALAYIISATKAEPLRQCPVWLVATWSTSRAVYVDITASRPTVLPLVWFLCETLSMWRCRVAACI